MIQSCNSEIFPVKARKNHDMESCKEADIEENVELPKESLIKSCDAVFTGDRICEYRQTGFRG